ncbi:MAG: RNA polymerase sigma factor [Spirochaetes bacterium]|nr:RNA polymerase sigma factor [Spirochaetota bacterium]
MMYNPFRNGIVGGTDDEELLAGALGGDRQALETLVRRHQPWIYNIACRMVLDLDEAEDITQEILIKLITHLSGYDPARGAFRTWLYRIVANHVLSLRRSRREEPLSAMTAGGDYFAALERIVDRRSSSMPENRVLAEESRITCITGMLLCLDRRSRMVFILGEIFGVGDALGSEIMEISRANFRTILSRSRGKVYNFFSQKCGLVDEGNPCRCSRAVDFQLKIGFIDPDRLISERGGIRVSEAVGERVNDLERRYSSKLRSLYGDGPFLDPPDMAEWLRDLMNSGEFREIFD